MAFNRREIVFGLGAIPLCNLPSITHAKSSFQLGSSEILSVSDGNLVLPKSMFFDGLPQAELNGILSKYNVNSEQLTPSCNLTLLRQGDKNVLFDAGSGSAFMPSAGAMLDSLEAIDVTPDDITHVIFTHAHPDHLWGVLDDFDDPVFANAELMIGQKEWDYWTDPNTVNSIGEARASFAVGAARRLLAVEDQMSFFNDNQEILSGVMAHSTPGHTPGHISFEVRNGSEAVMIGGDAIGNHHVAFERPDWHSGSDQDPEMGAKTRLRLLDQLATDKISLLGFHLPNGGLGQVERANGNYIFNEVDL